MLCRPQWRAIKERLQRERHYSKTSATNTTTSYTSSYSLQEVQLQQHTMKLDAMFVVLAALLLASCCSMGEAAGQDPTTYLSYYPAKWVSGTYESFFRSST
jgi:hypothetical protein